MSSSEVRLAALDYVMAITVSPLYSAGGFSPEMAEDLRRQVQKRMSLQPLTKVSDPAMSDVRSAEIVEGIDRLLAAAISMLRATKS